MNRLLKISLIVLALSASTYFAVKTIREEPESTNIDADRADGERNSLGITKQQLVDALGPGWRHNFSNPAVLHEDWERGESQVIATGPSVNLFEIEYAGGINSNDIAGSRNRFLSDTQFADKILGTSPAMRNAWFGELAQRKKRQSPGTEEEQFIEYRQMKILFTISKFESESLFWVTFQPRGGVPNF